jgi:hypothetical protein
MPHPFMGLLFRLAWFLGRSSRCCCC